MKRFRKEAIYFFTGITLLSMVNCGSKITKPNNNNNNILFQESVDLIDITNPVNGYYKMPNSLALPNVTKIPDYKNNDSLKTFLQNFADTFSWRSFIALNWPANEDGTPDSANTLGSESDFTVLEHWMPGTNLFVDSNQVPQDWNYGISENQHPLNSNKTTDFRIIPKFDSLDKSDAENLPLVDQNRKYTLFQIFYNRQAYDYVVKGKLYSKKGQQEFVKNWPSLTEGLKVTKDGKPLGIEETFKRAYFTVGTTKDSTITKTGIEILPDAKDANAVVAFKFVSNPGSVILKTAWRIMSPKDDKKRYYTRKVIIKSGEKIEIGLVAMHITHKASEATQWVWSTFEHIDNAPEMADDGSAIIDAQKNYSYFNKANNNPATFNLPTDTSLFFDGTPRKPAQVVRANKIEESTEKINDYFLGLIKKYEPESVWQYYKLIGTQWPFDPDLLTPGRNYTPEILANTALETFSQSTSSCMECHSQAKFLYDDPATRGMGYNADFIWGLANVK